MSKLGSRGRLTVILVTGSVLALVALFLRPSAEEMIDLEDIQPPGRWHLQSSRLDESTAGEELARVLSLPYMSGTQAAPSQTGVTRYDSVRALTGLNLYVSGHGPEVLLVDMQGTLIHRWHYPFEKAFPDKKPTIDTAYIRRALLNSDGDLLAIFQGGGMIKLDRDSNLIWASDLPYYNHLSLDEDGQILAITKTARVVPELRPEATILEDAIVLLTPEGELLRRVPLLDCFSASDFADLIHPLPDHPDIFHTNTVSPIASALAASSDVFRPGLLVVSLREIDTVALIDPEAMTVAAAWRGPWRAQHQPVPLASGKILLFDNKGAATGSRVVEFDPANGELSWVFPGVAQEALSSPEAGSCQRLQNGNTLITESEMARALEITPEGQVVWEFVNPHRAGEKQELVATLFEVIRYPVEALPFVENAGSR
jgi:hypothetical protein